MKMDKIVYPGMFIFILKFLRFAYPRVYTLRTPGCRQRVPPGVRKGLVLAFDFF